MNLQNCFNSVAVEVGRTPTKTPSKNPYGKENSDFNVSEITSTAKKMNYMNNSFYDTSSIGQSATNAGRNYGNNPSAANTTSSSSSGLNVDLMQSKIEHLEKERLELSLQLHKRNEKERSNKIKLEQLNNRIESYEENKKKLLIEVTRLNNENNSLKSEKGDLQGQVSKLMKEIQSSNHLETKDLWVKMTTLSTELKRIEKELILNNSEKNNLQKENSKLLLENQVLSDSNSLLSLEINELKHQLDSMMKEKELIENMTKEQKEKYHDMEASLTSLNNENHLLSLQIQELSFKNHSLLEEKQQLQEEKEENKQEIEQLLMIASQRPPTPPPAPVVTEIVTLPPPPPTELLEELATKDSLVSSLQAQLKELNEKLFENERKRKSLHNKLQEYKGNIRVLIRCRPFLSCDHDSSSSSSGSENDTYGQSLLLFHEDKTTLTVMNPSNVSSSSSTAMTTSNSRIQNHSFSFDHIFDNSSKQEDIYKEVTDLVQSVLDGYRVCIFSYGQTGSGKTHTMTGEKHGPNRGIIPRAFEELLEQSTKLQSMGWEISISVSIVELYNEEFRDLLLSSSSSSSSVSMKGNKQPQQPAEKQEKIKISYSNNRTMISGLTNHSIPLTKDTEVAIQQFHDLLELSSHTRTTAATNMNETSSRSHLIVLIDFIGKHTIHHNCPSNSSTSGKPLSFLFFLCFHLFFVFFF
jgi:kinesin family protein C1